MSSEPASSRLWLVRPLPLAVVILSIVGYYFVSFIVQLRQVRARYKDWPGPKHDSLWGHMRTLASYVKDDGYFLECHAPKLWQDIGRPPFFALDVWPLTRPNVLVICDPALMERIVRASPEQPTSWPKSPTYADGDALLTEDSIVRLHGDSWKTVRKNYSPGFTPKNLQGLLPEIIHEVKIFTSKLEESVDQVITLGEYTTTLTIDVIAMVVLGHSLDAQRSQSNLVHGFVKCIDWQVHQESLNPFHLYSCLRPLALYYYRRMLDNAIEEKITAAVSTKETMNPRSVINLAMQDGNFTSAPDVVRHTRNQVKAFLLAGHDTTSTFIQYMYYELWKHPDVLAKVREEHKSIFGAEEEGYLERVENMLIETPDNVLNAMVYTAALQKETLRHHGIATTARYAQPGSNLMAECNGKSYCLDGHILATLDAGMRMLPLYYGPDAAEFKPSRFLDTATWKIPPIAFRPFERGPRACIAQGMAYLEAKVILALTINTFEFEKVYDTKYKSTYSIRKNTAKPNDGMRMRVKKVVW